MENLNLQISEMKLILLIAAFAIAFINAVSSSSVEEAWAKFKLDHGKQYRGLHEETVRKAIFTENFNKIQEHNRLYDQGLVKYYLKINEFSDLTPEDMRASLNGFKKNAEVSDLIMTTFVPNPSAEIPDEIDWREEGAVSEVRNQGNCGSCWAFSAVGALEGQHFIKTGKLETLSEQNLMDCARAYSTNGCDGGDFTRSFIYVHENDGIDSDESYPYEAIDRTECLYKDLYNVTSTPGFAMIEEYNEEHLKAAVATVGPVSAAINGGRDPFMAYGGGIFDYNECYALLLNHAVLVVGYGSEDGEDYWIVKNSWGTSWGEDGYIRISRNKYKNCGIAIFSSFPLTY